ncbi:MAG: PilT/PilU family type 4a pilus ATPase [Candidatus Omnitrophica bacterium]|nr:PilT/PilU family type 4a pilus ATPase [Candidatus Omnitrophota bacterium]MCG2704369.1 PilT/PilU family type 4a pilus ATPase [Candidatus Omnitrophota bacterium]
MQDSLNFYAEMRASTRIRSRIKVKCYPLSGDTPQGPAFETVAKDISINGMRIQLDKPLDLDTKLKLIFRLAKIVNNIEIIARVIRIEELKDRKFDIGLTFENIQSGNQEEIFKRIESMDIVRLLQVTAQKKASDLHLTYNRPPILRIHGRLIPLEMDALGTLDLKDMIYSILSDEQIARFEKFKELDFAFSPNPELRFRVNVHIQRGNVEGTFRVIMPDLRTVQELGLPSVIEQLALLKKGIVIIAGPTGSGKTTTLAAMVDIINRKREAVIICLEDPIEYIHTNLNSIIKQREIGTDTLSFSVALRRCLRQDPDVILVGELLDPETVRTVITAAETGHLVLTSLHAPDTIQAIDRLISIFPPQQRHQACVQLANCLQGIITQLLVPKKDRETRVIATEVMITTDAVRNLIREGQTIQIPSVIQTGARYQMHTMSESFKRLYHAKIISKETAIDYCPELAQIIT